MKCPQVFSYAVIVIFTTVITIALSAPLDQSKLSLLDKQGYEVISGAEEFLAPVTSETDNNGIDVPEGLEPQKPDILLYGKFVVLRRKGLLHENEENVEPEHSFRSIVSNDRQTASASDIETVSKSEKQQQDEEDKEDSIVFPTSDTTTRKKKYIRQRKTNDEGTITSSIIPYFYNPSRTIQSETLKPSSTILPEIKDFSETRKPNPTSSHDDSQTKSNSQDTITKSAESSTSKRSKAPEDKTIEDIEGMSSDEFVEWTKWNLNTDEISQLLENSGVENDSSESVTESDNDEEEGTTESAIGYNSFIQVPTRINGSSGCPEGQKKNHKGICTKIYIHNERVKTRMARGNARTKLTSLFASLKALDHMTVDALVESEKELVKEAVRIHRELRNREITSDMYKRLSSSSSDKPLIEDSGPLIFS